MKKLILSAIAIFTFGIAMNLQAQSNLISVTGEAIVYATPEIAKANIPLSAKHVQYAECSDKLLNTYNALANALEKAGFDKKSIKASRFNIAEDFNYQDRSRVKIGYVGNMSLTLKMDMNPDNMGKLISVMNKEEFSFGYSINFELSEKQKTSLEEEAMQKAVAQAKQHAQVLCEAAGVYQDGILSITYGNSAPNFGPLVMKQEAAMMRDNNGAADINPNEMEIRKHVDITWRLSTMPPRKQ